MTVAVSLSSAICGSCGTMPPPLVRNYDSVPSAICRTQYSRPGMIDVLNPPGFELGPAPPPEVNAKCGEAAGRYLQLAYELAGKSKVDGVVMAPMNKESFRRAGYDYFDELEYLGDITGCADPFILGAAGPIWAVSLTEHIPSRILWATSSAIAYCAIFITCKMFLTSWAFDQPRIAVAALNPHAGEGGLFGREEIDEIAAGGT